MRFPDNLIHKCLWFFKGNTVRSFIDNGKNEQIITEKRVFTDPPFHFQTLPSSRRGVSIWRPCCALSRQGLRPPPWQRVQLGCFSNILSQSSSFTPFLEPNYFCCTGFWSHRTLRYLVILLFKVWLLNSLFSKFHPVGRKNCMAGCKTPGREFRKPIFQSWPIPLWTTVRSKGSSDLSEVPTIPQL